MLESRWQWLIKLGGVLAGILGTLLTSQSKGGSGQGGSSVCRCPKCGYSMPHARGVPCSAIECPRCSTRMRGENC